ncbi:MAG: CAP domain-containing protein [Cyanobacteria bacterium P01_F01_bin.143]
MDAQFMNEVLALVNEERSNAGLNPLEFDAQLETAAKNHSESMAFNDFFGHQDPIDRSSASDRIDEVGYDWSTFGENVAAGYSNPETVMNAWMNSSGHRANILNPDFTEIGIGYEFLENDTGSVNYNHYWTQVFGTPIDASSEQSVDEIDQEQSVDDQLSEDETTSEDNSSNNLDLVDNLTESINEERINVGLDPLQVNEQLSEVAQNYSLEMASGDFVSHQGLDGSTPGERIAESGYEASVWGENIVVNSDDVDMIMDYFMMGSSGNRENILDPDFQDIGVGYEYLENDTGSVNYQHYVTISFGSSEV